MADLKTTEEDPVSAVALNDLIRLALAGGGNGKASISQVFDAFLPLIPDSSAFIYAANVWVDAANGDDGTGVAGDPFHPFQTIDASLDATVAEPATVLHLMGTTAFAPVTDDRSGSSVNPSSKLRSNLWFKGQKQPTLDSWTTPTQLVNGTIIKGRLNFHSTRHNILLTDGGTDVGSAVCGALFGGTAQEGLLFNNIPQTASLAPSRRMQVHRWTVLCKAADSAVHAFLNENTVDFVFRDCESYYGAHGFAMKGAYGVLDGLTSRGHSNDVIIWKDGGAAANVAPCHDLTVTNINGGAFAAGDTPDGLVFDSGGASAQMKRLAISNVSLVGISGFEVKTLNSGSVSAPCMSDIRIDNLVSDNGLIRTSIHANTDKNSFFINGQPFSGVVALTDGSTINTDADPRRGSGTFSVAPAATRTLANPTNLLIGQTYVWLIDTTSGSIGTYGSLFDFYTATTASGLGVDVITAVYDGTKLRSTYTPHL